MSIRLNLQVYLYMKASVVIGCLIVESINKAFRKMPNDILKSSVTSPQEC